MSPAAIRENYPILLTRRQVLEVMWMLGGSEWRFRCWVEEGRLTRHILPGCVYARYWRDEVLRLMTTPTPEPATP